MAAYLVACITWHDPKVIEEYGAIARDSMERYGGKYLARGAPVAAIEGEGPNRLAIVEFPSPQAARDWAGSKEYAPAVAIRHKNATTHWILIMDQMPQSA